VHAKFGLPPTPLVSTMGWGKPEESLPPLAPRANGQNAFSPLGLVLGHN
jgi:hypothetical protein